MDHTHVASSIIFIHIAPLLHTDGLQRWPADNPSPPSLPLRARLRARPTARISYAPASSALVFPISISKKISFERERETGAHQIIAVETKVDRIHLLSFGSHY